MLTAEKVRAVLETLSPTQEKVDLAVKTAVEIAQPSRVILFGSWPRGEARVGQRSGHGSADAQLRRIRIGQIHRKLRRKLEEIPMTIDLIMPPRAMRANFAAPSIRSITAYSKTARWPMNSGPYTQAQILLIKAAEDETALHVDGNPESVLGFHAQQAVEKLIKALLSQLATPFELTHNLLRLPLPFRILGEVLPITPVPISDLNDFAVNIDTICCFNMGVQTYRS